MQRPSASFDFIHRRRGEWRSNEWHPAFIDIVRSNSRYEVRETAGYHHVSLEKSILRSNRKARSMKKGLRVILLISPERSLRWFLEN